MQIALIFKKIIDLVREVENGADLAIGSRFLGHSEGNAIARHYSRVPILEIGIYSKVHFYGSGNIPRVHKSRENEDLLCRVRYTCATHWRFYWKI
ncbi:MAG: hypothetical protein ACE5J3_09740 [Methanosarcinales archaeon]